MINENDYHHLIKYIFSVEGEWKEIHPYDQYLVNFAVGKTTSQNPPTQYVDLLPLLKKKAEGLRKLKAT